jgi:hypothetical protein
VARRARIFRRAWVPAPVDVILGSAVCCARRLGRARAQKERQSEFARGRAGIELLTPGFSAGYLGPNRQGGTPEAQIRRGASPEVAGRVRTATY